MLFDDWVDLRCLKVVDLCFVLVDFEVWVVSCEVGGVIQKPGWFVQVGEA
jgi:hypothetical protein